MKQLQYQLEQHPVISVLIAISLSIGLLYLAKFFGSGGEVLFDWPRLLVQNGVSLGLIYLLVKLDWSKGAGITTPISEWHNKWFLAMLPLLTVGLINYFMQDWAGVSFNTINLVAWLIANFSTGLFEEVLLRGFSFYVLYRAWGSSNKGMIKAAFVQALIFGLVHLLNMARMPVIDVVAQVIYSMLLGFSFAGLTLFARSIWPAVFIHMFINCIGSISEYFNPAYDADAIAGPGIAGYIVGITLIFLIATLPGLWLLKKSSQYAGGSYEY